MSEQGPGQVPSAGEQIIEHGMIVEAPRPDGAPLPLEDGHDLMYGGYTGVKVGEIADKISQLQLAGKTDEAAALRAQLDNISPPVDTPEDRPEA